MTVWHLVVLGSLLIASLAQMALKKGAMNKYGSFIREYLNIWVIGGYALMFLSMVIDIWAVRNGVLVKELSTMESCSYLFVPLMSRLFFGEKISLRKFGAIILILSGVIVFFV